MIVVVTRDPRRGKAWVAARRAEGHELVFVPLTRIEDAAPFPDPAAFDGVLFTSVNAVARAPAGATWPRVGAVGPATAGALRARGIKVDVAGEGAGGGADLARLWGAANGPAHAEARSAKVGRRCLVPQAEDAQPDLADALRAAGADVVAVAVYRSVPRDRADVDVAALERADEVWFFAGSQVRAFLTLGVTTKARLRAEGRTAQLELDRLDPS